MAELQKLSAPHCILLAVQFASEANINALRILTARRQDAFAPELSLRILLTYLPESVETSIYTQYLYDLATSPRLQSEKPVVALDISLVKELSDSQARRRTNKLHLLSLAHPLYRNESGLDPLTLFLIHRAHRIDSETGLLDLVAQLVVPFLDHSEYLRTWFISTVLPPLRLGYEYYPQNTIPSLDTFAQLKGTRAIELQLSNLQHARRAAHESENAGRDLRGVIGPWMCGANERKRRKLDVEQRRASIGQQQEHETDDWECLFEWLVHTSKDDLTLISSVIADWDGPKDIDLGGYDDGHVYMDEDRQRQLELRYAQSALASLYLVDGHSPETIKIEHAILTRVATLLDLDPPPDLNVGLVSIPSYDPTFPVSHDSSANVLQSEQLLRQDNILTQPGRNTFLLLELFIFSACVLSSVRHDVSVRDLAKMYLRDDSAEQFSLLQKILHSISSGPRTDDEQWRMIRTKLLWLWDWGAKKHEGGLNLGRGIFGKIERETFETEILKALLEGGHYSLAIKLYIQAPSDLQLPLPDVEKVVLASSMENYDNASNGNRTRGGMKRASDIIAAFGPYFPSSSRFRRTQALLSATHAMSFYSLILQHGVPFQPVNIRVSSDPLSLLRKLLSQNSRSYTHLDDLISIGQNLLVSMPSTLMDEDSSSFPCSNPAEVEKKKAAAERRVIGMAVEAALEEDDFETAYSYVINRLSPASPSDVSPAASESSQRFSMDSNYSVSLQPNDYSEDVSWRAAFLAGRHRSSPLSSSMTSGKSTARPHLRRLEQRMELLSQALLLAPPGHLEEVLAVWQQCEAEMTSLLAEETEIEQRFNDFADRKLPGAFANETVAVQPRREVGRGAVEEAPMGLFDVARGAAAAFSKSAFPLRGSNVSTSRAETRDIEGPQGRVSSDLTSESGSIGGGDEGRVRKRDMVANAVTGGLASGLGWVLGATPVQDQDSP
ncbi:secretory pathway Sec39 [Zopfia rhizophila CBS 207.26]|uniref:Secretory pathway Sec39 n=1 Tax=Zopfia rhizophila CBS 207.26 TaxID=1314779 RepID=A0A6A6DYT0_9PEZI|nr:secretory pathway Sec39 [Zopfia rhizophila CBS 207.26]